WTIPQVMFFAARVPAPLLRVNEIKAMLLTLVKANVVEDEELGFGSEVGSIGKSGGCQVHFGLASDVARIAIVALFGDRIHHIRNHHESGDFGEGIEQVSVRVGNEQHVALMDRGPPANG